MIQKVDDASFLRHKPVRPPCRNLLLIVRNKLYDIGLPVIEYFSWHDLLNGSGAQMRKYVGTSI